MKLYVVLESGCVIGTEKIWFDEFIGAFETKDKAIEAIRKVYGYYTKENNPREAVQYSDLKVGKSYVENGILSVKFSERWFGEEHTFDIIEYQTDTVYRES